MEILALAIDAYDFSENEISFTLRFINVFLGEKGSL